MATSLRWRTHSARTNSLCMASLTLATLDTYGMSITADIPHCFLDICVTIWDVFINFTLKQIFEFFICCFVLNVHSLVWHFRLIQVSWPKLQHCACGFRAWPLEHLRRSSILLYNNIWNHKESNKNITINLTNYLRNKGSLYYSCTCAYSFAYSPYR